MKKIFLLFTISLASISAYAQSSSVDAKSITAAKYANQAAIDAAIASPEEGMQVYNIALKNYMVYDGVSWKIQGGNSSGWSLQGNAGTNAATNFIGTTDYQDLRFKVGNNHAGAINLSSGNTSYGVSTLTTNTTGFSNSASGGSALQKNTTGYVNTASGWAALQENSTGNYNSAFGGYSLFNNTTGSNNTALGSSALRQNTIGIFNTALGQSTLYSNRTGGFNTASGSGALYNNVSGSNNTANGASSLSGNNSGKDNTALGQSAMYSNSAGNFNTATGSLALRSNTTGNSNTAIGYQTLFNNTTGANNTALGDSALHSNATGRNNTSIGYEAGHTNFSGNHNTFLGAYSNASITNLSNSVAIGFGTTVNASNKVQIGNQFITTIEGQVPFTNPSDRRLKENIKHNNTLGLEFVSRLQPVSYNYIADATKLRHDGFIAQDVEQTMKSLGVVFSGLKKDTEGMYSLAYSDFVMPLVNAVKELKSEVDDLKKKNEVLEALVLRVTALEELKVQNTLPAIGK